MRVPSGPILLTLALTMLLAGPARAGGGPSASASPQGTDEAVAAADALLRRLAAEAVGLSVAVAAETGVIWSAAYGDADREAGEPVTPDTRMRLYSIAKPMTAVAAARLMERGALDPAAPVQTYVPAFPDKGAPITTLQLAEHTSGIRHYADDAEARGRRHCESVAEALTIFAGDPLVHAPGEKRTYSSWGYVLLSAVLEGVTGQGYESAMGELVFAPAGLGSLAIDDPGVEVPGRARFYRETAPGAFAAAEPVDNTCKWGAGAWVGTAGDVARFGVAMFDGTLLQPRTAQMFLRGEPVYRAQGWSAGGMAFLIADDEHGLAVALLSNAAGETLGPRLQEVAGRIHTLFTTTERDRPAGSE